MSGSRLKRVLVVEHDDGIATALEYLISREGLDQDRVASGSAAIERIRKFRPDLVLLDATVPGISGYDICRSVRDDRELSHIKILLMTARGPAGERRRGTDLGADGFVSKPFELKDLRDQMRRLLAAGV
ncbi:response regulator [Tabrizicola sp. J26]|uniref:response regulator n=1 Tax=Alitabrizicola rongguiensis TaxID=2909234 RepID=UPI001F16DD19|nr:response regulator [Tabrizicola rongguiensis]MCF1707880.1 response regulator [Tabrizicola rongguiensis]